MNKFNIHWQIVRTKAKRIKNAHLKTEFVRDFLDNNKNVYNFGRVLNWAKMTKLGYPENSIERVAFDELIAYMKVHQEEYDDSTDTDNDLTKISTKNLQMVFDDLSKRKYNFQFNKTPEDHKTFMIELKDELSKRQ